MEKGRYLRRHLAHFGAILTNLGVIGIAYCAGALFSGLLSVLYILFLVLLSGISLGMLFLSENFRNMWSNVDKITNFVTKIYDTLPYVFTIATIILVVALIFLLMDKNWNKSKPRIILNIVLLSILSLLFIAFMVSLISGEGK